MNNLAQKSRMGRFVWPLLFLFLAPFLPKAQNIDLALSLTATPTSPAIYTNAAVKLTISNTGSQTATNIKVKFAKPTGVVYTGGNEYTAPSGTSFTPFGAEEWSIPSLAGGGSMLLTVNYFLLQTSPGKPYAQVTAVSQSNDPDSQPNNGTPPNAVQDDEASYTFGGGGGTQQPDLTLADLQIPTASVAAGAILSYNFDASNAGTAGVSGNFTIKSYISTDQTLSTNDVQDGTIQTGNYAAGFSVQNVAGASTIPASLTAGSYYLIVKIDGDNAIAEGNENNNTVVKSFTVTTGGGGGGSACNFFRTYGAVTFQAHLPPKVVSTASGGYNLQFFDPSSTSSTYRELVLDASGNQVSLTNYPVTRPNPSTINRTLDNGFIIVQWNATGATHTGTLIKRTLSNTQVFSKSLTLTIPSSNVQSSSVNSVVSVPDGYLVAGTYTYLAAANQPRFVAFIIKADLNGNQLSQTFFPEKTDYFSPVIATYGPANNVYMFWNTLVSSYKLARVNTALNGWLWENTILSDLPSSSLRTLAETADGSAIYEAAYSNQQGFVRKYNSTTGVIIWERGLETLLPTTEYAFEYANHGAVMPDGGFAVGLHWLLPGFNTGGVQYGRFDANGNVLWTKQLSVAAYSDFDLGASFATSDGGLLFTGSQAPASTLAVMRVNAANGELTPACSTPAGPDYVITAGAATPSTVPIGGTTSFNFTVKNNGTASAAANTISFWRSETSAPGTSSWSLGSVNVPALAAGATANLTFSYTVPFTNTGSYFVVSKVDFDNSVIESNELNNWYAFPFTIGTAPQQPDLAIQNPSAVVTVLPSGVSMVGYLFYLQNLGTAPANYVNVGFYLSTDQAWSASDVFLGEGVGFNPGTGQTAQIGGEWAIPSGTAAGNYYLLIVADWDNAYAESNESNNTAALPITLTSGSGGGGTPDCASITITPSPGKITIAGFSAPHVLIKVFRPNWTVAFECLDGACTNPVVVSGLTTGSHYVEVKLLNASWGEICKKTQTVGVTNIAQQDDRQRLSFDKFYPNPTAYLTTMELYSPVAQQATLDFYDRTGRLVHTMEVQLDKGQNLIEQLVFDWKSGTYNVIARGEKTALPAYGRFLKVWEE
ncbi:MAG: hypothetical protein IT258_03650 [Saprospiraceae bacterium]|nr:hypothetical protein [Saprospiraceae bacterium]